MIKFITLAIIATAIYGASKELAGDTFLVGWWAGVIVVHILQYLLQEVNS